MYTFHFSLKTIFINVLSTLFLLLIFSPVLFTVILVPAIWNYPNAMLKILIVPMIILGVLVVAAYVMLLLGLVMLWSGNYIKVSASGLEYHQWPSIAMRCNWTDIEKIGKDGTSVNFLTDSISFKHGEWLGWRLMLFVRKRLGLNPFVVPIQRFDGWENGKLKAQIREYVPAMFTQNV